MTFSAPMPTHISAKVISIISRYDLTSLPIDEKTIPFVLERFLLFSGLSCLFTKLTIIS